MSDAKPRDLTVGKIGGTSIADTRAILDNVLIGNRTGGGLYNRVFVVSAYAGVTSKLLEHKKTGDPGVYALFANSETDWVWADALTEVGEYMRKINADVHADLSDRRAADTFVYERIEGARSCLLDLQRLCSYGHFCIGEHLSTVREMLSAIGEAHSAHNTVLLLKQHGANAVFVDLTGWRDENHPTLDQRIVEGLVDIDLETELPIVTGYAHCCERMMEQFGRGYTEVTFSRLAALVQAQEAIIHKEFHLSSADPKLVGQDRVKTIGRTNYDVGDQLANLGMEAVHPDAAKILRQAEIPLRVKNTFDPDDAGTVICADYASEVPRAEIVTGLKGLHALEFFEQDMVGVKGYDASILEALKRHDVRIVTKASNANTITHYLAGSLKAVRRVISDLEQEFPAAEIALRKVAIVSAIGSDLSLKGLTVIAVAALTDADIEILGVHQLMRNVDIQFVVHENDFKPAIRALHAALVENDRSSKGLQDISQKAA